MSVILYTTFSTLPGIVPSVYFVSRKFIFHHNKQSMYLLSNFCVAVLGLLQPVAYNVYQI